MQSTLRDPRLLLEDILESCAKIQRYTLGVTFDTFQSSDMVFDATARNLEIIGEAVKLLPAELRDSHTEIDWRKIAGLRDVVIHHYFGIDEALIWDVVQNWIPRLQKVVADIVTSN